MTREWAALLSREMPRAGGFSSLDTLLNDPPYSLLPNRRPIPNKRPGCRKYQKLIGDHYLIADQVDPWVQN